MPPRRKATKRKNKDEDSSTPSKLPRGDSENTQIKQAIVSKREEAGTTALKSKGKLDKIFQIQLEGKKNPSIHGEYACMLNQTNITDNNNKYYVIQIAQAGKTFYLFTRWGRVGEDGANKLEEFNNNEDAEKGFKKKFQDKTGNKWENRTNFVAKNKKYTLLEMDDESGDESEEETGSKPVIKVEKYENCADCTLDERTQIALELLFNSKMFEDQMMRMDLDVKKMPLGKLSKLQIGKGIEALIEVEEAVKNKESREMLAQLSSKFFTLIPHNFGRSVPPVLDNLTIIQAKKDIMMTLSDIELAQNLKEVKKEPEKIHPLDASYNSLRCDMQLLKKNSKNFKLFEQYIKATSGNSWNSVLKLVDVWELNRLGEASRYSVNDKVGNRKLLWHGTSVAVVAAILNSGLRIMPHSGGRVGKGIYLASEYSKSAGYCGSFYQTFHNEDNTTFMFLAEAALGKPSEIKVGNSNLKKAPAGYDSVIARGITEPDPKKDVKLEIDEREVVIPVGKPVRQPDFSDSHFSQSEYLLYNEHQVRLRYLLKFVAAK